jgi:hypothetical protein
MTKILSSTGGRPEWSASLATHAQGEDLVVPPSHYFVMGNIEQIVWIAATGGWCRENILGRPLLVYWSIEMPEFGVEEVPLKEQAVLDPTSPYNLR